MDYNVDYFIAKFKAIPKDKWAIRKRHGDNGTHCAHGWCDIYETNGSTEESALIEVFKPLLDGFGCAPINNGQDPRYQQSTPKQRVLAALYDIKKLQEPKQEKPKEIIEREILK